MKNPEETSKRIANQRETHTNMNNTYYEQVNHIKAHRKIYRKKCKTHTNMNNTYYEQVRSYGNAQTNICIYIYRNVKHRKPINAEKHNTKYITN